MDECKCGQILIKRADCRYYCYHCGRVYKSVLVEVEADRLPMPADCYVNLLRPIKMERGAW